jgi:hypothetical protein
MLVRRICLVGLALASCATRAPPPRVTIAASPAPTSRVVEAPHATETPKDDSEVAAGEMLRTGAVTFARDAPTAIANNARALRLFQSACARDVARGCELAAETLQDHAYYGVQPDDRTVATDFDRACNLGDGHACYRLAFDIQEGLLFFVVDKGQLRPLRWDEDRSTMVAPLLDRACDVLHDQAACKLRSDL